MGVTIGAYPLGRWRNGRRSGLKIRRGNTHVGSSPTRPTSIMNPEQFRRLYDYDFAANRDSWDRCVAPRPVEQFRQQMLHSIGSVRT